MSKAVKGMVIDEITDRLGEHRDLLVVNTSRLDAFAVNQWRLALRTKQIHVLTVRNTLAGQALERLGVTGLDSLLTGPTTLIYGGQDVVALSKELMANAKEMPNLEVKGATVEGSVLDAAGVESLSKSPGREELIAKVLGQILAPGANLAAALLGPGSTLASQLKTIYDKDGEGSTEAAGGEAAAAESAGTE